MNKFYLFRKLFIVLLLLATFPAWSQTSVTGSVTTGDGGYALPAVSILEKGTTNGTVADVERRYFINAGENATLVFSFVGFTTQEVSVSGKTSADVSLQGDGAALSEVVIINHGQLERKEVTGAHHLNQHERFSPQDLLVVKVAGLQVTSHNGAPGSGSTIRIRGGSFLSASNDPLIVIDGFPVDNTTMCGSPNALATINPNDIESFTVLKEASATAIYGSRASTGVTIFYLL